MQFMVMVVNEYEYVLICIFMTKANIIIGVVGNKGVLQSFYFFMSIHKIELWP